VGLSKSQQSKDELGFWVDLVDTKICLENKILPLNSDD
jgi:hypothetical protein